MTTTEWIEQMERELRRERMGMKFYRNTAWKDRDYECTNVVACQALHKPEGDQWVEADASITNGLMELSTRIGGGNEITFFGYL